MKKDSQSRLHSKATQTPFRQPRRQESLDTGVEDTDHEATPDREIALPFVHGQSGMGKSRVIPESAPVVRRQCPIIRLSPEDAFQKLNQRHNKPHTGHRDASMMSLQQFEEWILRQVAEWELEQNAKLHSPQLNQPLNEEQPN